MIYLASPYTHPDPDVVAQRVLETQRNAVALWVEHNVFVFSPIMHWHHAAVEQDLPTDAESWQGYNEHMMRFCEAVYVLCLDGWENSKGVAAEIRYAQLLHLPIIYLNEPHT
jgi:hypothetical protein